MKKPVRNLVIFALATVGGGFLGIGVDQLAPGADRMQGLGVLVWLVCPLVTHILLRTLGGVGWKDSGIKPHFRDGWIWYLASFALIPVVTLLLLFLGRIAGGNVLAGEWQTFLAVALTAFSASLVKNIFEEFSWRGFLTPYLNGLKTPFWLNYLLTGWIWAGWHIPYYLYFLPRDELARHTALGPWQLIFMALLLLPLQAFLYGELRLLSRSVWPAYLMHCMANAISLSMLSGGFVRLTGGVVGTIFSPGSEGILYSLLMALVGYSLYSIRMKKEPKE